MIAVEIGAGVHPRVPNAITTDVVGYPTVRCDARALPFADGSVMSISAVDVLEHISYRETAATLEEWARVMCADGELFVQVPDADRLMRWYVSQPQRLGRAPSGVPGTPLGIVAWKLLGGHADDVYANGETWRYNAHYALFSQESLQAHLTTAGFDVERVVVNQHPNIMCWARRSA